MASGAIFLHLGLLREPITESVLLAVCLRVERKKAPQAWQ